MGIPARLVGDEVQGGGPVPLSPVMMQGDGCLLSGWVGWVGRWAFHVVQASMESTWIGL